ncbi:MAG: DUF1501 domain-containing protein [Candidatus Thiodiazotropha sp. (ex Semelilucina semeliformis)]|nr:DUF1501 domain-containing protein [Candidatus Thiodiazotropha sp. (ex Semelilucina semeliformis)]
MASTDASAGKLLSQKDVFVCLFQRGAADGLNSLVPYGDSDYYTHRNAIAVPAPGNPGGGIDLDGYFALHPSLDPLKPIYDMGELAFVHATGMPHDSRSHFTAQDLVESGVTAKPLPDSGWLGRHLALSVPTTESAFRVISISGNVPVSLQGSEEPLAISNLGEFGFDQDVIDAGYTDVLLSLFHDQAPFAHSAQAALLAVDALQAANLPALVPENGAVYPNSELGNKLKQAGQLIKSNLSVEVIFIDSGDWDHHESLPNNLQQSLSDLAGSMSAFHTDMGSRMQGISLFVMTEFGRRVAENASVYRSRNGRPRLCHGGRCQRWSGHRRLARSGNPASPSGRGSGHHDRYANPAFGAIDEAPGRNRCRAGVSRIYRSHIGESVPE